MPLISRLAAALTPLLLASPALAQDTGTPPPAKDARTLDALIVTGTRVSDRTVATSQSPIDILTPEVLQSTGTTELATALARALPSLNFPRPAVADGTSGVRPAQLRGLAPDQVLILVNGKRRHISALVNVNGTIGRGASAVDLNAIPIAAIERVEVLRDGASAQYGSDAIAGVVNIVLKSAPGGGSLALSGGEYSAGDGAQWQLAGDLGTSFARDAGSLHVAAETGHQAMTNRAGAYQGSTPDTSFFPGIGEVAFKIGDPEVDATALAANASLKLGDNARLYASLIGSNRRIRSFAFYRSVNHGGQGALLTQVYPDGYVPEIHQDADDRSLVLGAKGLTTNGWNWDISYDFGDSQLDFRTENTINYTLGINSPHAFRDGSLHYTQQVVNADFSKPIDIGLAYPATFSLGGEYRKETWEQTAGEPASYNDGGLGTPGAASGAQGFPGFTPRNAGSHDRHNHALYAGLEGDFSEQFSAGVAGRYEDYSDFGSQFSGKLSGRYAFNETAALRGTVATGFRAPSLAQQHYQVVTTNISNGVATEAGTFPASGAAAQALGADPLQAETSQSASLGLVLQPAESLYLAIDVYRIDIDDRIVLSSNIPLAGNTAAQDLLASLGITGVTSARYFNNAIDTRTHGLDIVGSWQIALAASRLDLTASYNRNKTEVTRVAPNPPELEALDASLERIDREERGRIEEGAPRDKFTFSAAWALDRWHFNLGTTRYGSFTTRHRSGPSRDQTYAGQWVFDASATMQMGHGWQVSVGVDNAFDEYPEQTIAQNSTFGIFPYSLQSPAGFNGRYWYGRISYGW